MRRSFFWKLYLSYAALVLASAAIIGALVLGNLRRNALRELSDDLLGTVRLLASMEAANPAHLWSDQLARQIAEVAGDTGLHLLLLYANGSVAAESGGGAETASAPDFLQLPEFVSARRHSFGQATRPLASNQLEYLFIATPILLDYEVVGYVRAGLPLTRLAQRQRDLRDRVLMGASLNALLALGLGFLVARQVTRPLAEIGEVCRRIADGDLTQRVAVRRRDEIGVVGATLNQMAGDVQRRIANETRERQRLAALLSVMADGVIAVSARQTIAYLNAVAARLLGLNLATASGQLFRDHVRVAAVLEVYADACASDRRIRREVRITGHPEDLVLRIDATPLLDPDGHPFGVLLVLHDLSEVRRLENVRRVFSANVSHELKTPLTAIGSLVDALLDDDAMGLPTRRRFLGKIRDQNDRLYRLVHDLLMISRLESERDALELHELDLGALAADCVQTFEETARNKGVGLSFAPPESPIVVRANDEAVRLILNNLLQNAVLYTPAGRAVRMDLSAAADLATIVVSDTGVGIAPEHLERIFERFYRVDKARARHPGGAGLGLSIVKHLTQVLGGRVLVESKTGEGSVFTVQLPIAPAPADPSWTAEARGLPTT